MSYVYSWLCMFMNRRVIEALMSKSLDVEDSPRCFLGSRTLVVMSCDPRTSRAPRCLPYRAVRHPKSVCFGSPMRART
jgi:hypothetical protein